MRWHTLAELATAEIPVIVNPLLNAPQSFDAITARADNAARLIEAGVNVIITSEQTHNARNLRQVAGNAVRAGVGHHDAVMAITQTPAEVFGVSDSGRLEAGAKANIVVWSGDPLELRTQALRVISQSIYNFRNTMIQLGLYSKFFNDMMLHIYRDMKAQV